MGVVGDGVGEADGVSSGALGSLVALGALAAAAELLDDDEEDDDEDEAELDPLAAPVELDALPERVVVDEVGVRSLLDPPRVMPAPGSTPAVLRVVLELLGWRVFVGVLRGDEDFEALELLDECELLGLSGADVAGSVAGGSEVGSACSLGSVAAAGCESLAGEAGEVNGASPVAVSEVTRADAADGGNPMAEVTDVVLGLGAATIDGVLVLLEVGEAVPAAASSASSTMTSRAWTWALTEGSGLGPACPCMASTISRASSVRPAEMRSATTLTMTSSSFSGLVDASPAGMSTRAFCTIVDMIGTSWPVSAAATPPPDIVTASTPATAAARAPGMRMVRGAGRCAIDRIGVISGAIVAATAGLLPRRPNGPVRSSIAAASASICAVHDANISSRPSNDALSRRPIRSSRSSSA
ncbi:hypothetical protein [Piscicoccus intestinalis]|uniref:hypothetical protein n=1 Tax=Piscicoccus intestinalis TaxID=746033 RepID=UPI000838D62E|nr:hypothetical protein [Piscicoccus intestinalis]